MMTTDLPENIRFTFAGREHRYAGVEINGTMVPVKDLLAWVERIGLEPQESRAAESEPTYPWPFPTNAARSWNGFNVVGDEASIKEVGRLAHCEERLKWFEAEVLELRAKLSTIEAAPVQGAEQ